MWNYTPRELMGWLWYAQRRQKRERVEGMVYAFNAARGDPKAINKALKEAARE